MNQPLVSVIMSNYNGERFVAQTIKSVLNQTYSNFEFIIIDDCSTDRSRDIICSYTDKRIQTYFFDRNEQMCFAFNYGLEYGTGKYYARIDSDDTWRPDKLEKQVSYMEEHENCGACFTLVNVVDENDNLLSEQDTDRVLLFNTQNKNRLDWLHYFFFKGSCLCHPSVVFRRDVIQKVGNYNYSLRQIQDYDLWIRIAKIADIHVLQERLTNYRWFLDGSNASAPSTEVNNRSNYEFAYVLSRFFDNMSDADFISAFKEDFLNPASCTKEELACEKVFLLLKPAFCGNYHRAEALNRIVPLLQNDVTRAILKEKYNFTQKNFYELASIPLYAEPIQHIEAITPTDTALLGFDWKFWLHEHLPKLLWKIGAGVYHLVCK